MIIYANKTIYLCINLYVVYYNDNHIQNVLKSLQLFC